MVVVEFSPTGHRLLVGEGLNVRHRNRSRIHLYDLRGKRHRSYTARSALRDLYWSPGVLGGWTHGLSDLTQVRF